MTFVFSGATGTLKFYNMDFLQSVRPNLVPKLAPGQFQVVTARSMVFHVLVCTIVDTQLFIVSNYSKQKGRRIFLGHFRTAETLTKWQKNLFYFLVCLMFCPWSLIISIKFSEILSIKYFNQQNLAYLHKLRLYSHKLYPYNLTYQYQINGKKMLQIYLKN